MSWDCDRWSTGVFEVPLIFPLTSRKCLEDTWSDCACRVCCTEVRVPPWGRRCYLRKCEPLRHRMVFHDGPETNHKSTSTRSGFLSLVSSEEAECIHLNPCFNCVARAQSSDDEQNQTAGATRFHEEAETSTAAIMAQLLRLEHIIMHSSQQLLAASAAMPPRQRDLYTLTTGSATMPAEEKLKAEPPHSKLHSQASLPRGSAVPSQT